MSNSFGKIFKITTFGESHGKQIGVVIDGCPSNLDLKEEEITEELSKRKPGNYPFSSKRKEEDKAKILSGVFEGKTTGAPISILIENKDFKKEDYEDIKDLFRPGHSNFCYKKKYGNIDPYGAGRSSARETCCRVAAGYIAKKLLKTLENVEVLSFIKKIKNISVDVENLSFSEIKEKIEKSKIFCPDPKKGKKILKYLKKIEKEKDTIGGVLQLISTKLPNSLGEPIFNKLSASLASAMFSIPSVVAFEIGSGFSTLKGSENNDLFDLEKEKIITKTNNCGGILAGVSTGMPLNLKIGFKPISSIKKPQKTLSFKKEEKTLILKENFRSDISSCIRAPKIIEAMAAIVLIDFVFLKRSNRI